MLFSIIAPELLHIIAFTAFAILIFLGLILLILTVTLILKLKTQKGMSNCLSQFHNYNNTFL